MPARTTLIFHATTQQQSTSWVVESTGEATCSKDYESMHAPVVELMAMEDVALAVNYLNPTLSGADVKSLYGQGTVIANP